MKTKLVQITHIRDAANNWVVLPQSAAALCPICQHAVRDHGDHCVVFSPREDGVRNVIPHDFQVKVEDGTIYTVPWSSKRWRMERNRAEKSLKGRVAKSAIAKWGTAHTDVLNGFLHGSNQKNQCGCPIQYPENAKEVGVWAPILIPEESAIESTTE